MRDSCLAKAGIIVEAVLMALWELTLPPPLVLLDLGVLVLNVVEFASKSTLKIISRLVSYN